ELDEHQRTLDRLAESHFLHGRISEGAYRRIADGITEEMKEITTELGTWGIRLPKLDRDETLQSAFVTKPLWWKRTLLEAVIEKIRIKPGEVKRNFDSDRLDITWR